MELVKIDLKFPNWKAKVEKARDEIMLAVAAEIQANRAMLFDSEGAFNGHKAWKKLVLRNGMALSNRGVLRKSIAPPQATGRAGPGGIVRFEGDIVRMITTVKGAALMNYGGKVTAKKAKALKIPIPQGAKAGDGAKAIQRQVLTKQLAVLGQKLSKTKGKKSQERLMGQIARIRERMKEGKGPVKFIFRKSVVIPPRPFNEWTSRDQASLEQVLAAKIKEILER